MQAFFFKTKQVSTGTVTDGLWSQNLRDVACREVTCKSVKEGEEKENQALLHGTGRSNSAQVALLLDSEDQLCGHI